MTRDGVVFMVDAINIYRLEAQGNRYPQTCTDTYPEMVRNRLPRSTVIGLSQVNLRDHISPLSQLTRSRLSAGKKT